MNILLETTVFRDGGVWEPSAERSRSGDEEAQERRVEEAEEQGAARFRVQGHLVHAIPEHFPGG